MQLNLRGGPTGNPKPSAKTVAAALVLVAPLALALDGQDLAGLPPPLVEKVAAARQACGDFQNGKFSLEWGAVSRADLDGDLYPDWVLNESAYSCSTAVSLYCSTGGCMSHFMLDDTVSSFRNQGWTLVTFGRHRVLLTDVHGTDCGGVNSTPCVVARTWDPEKNAWQSVGARTE